MGDIEKISTEVDKSVNELEKYIVGNFENPKLWGKKIIDTTKILGDILKEDYKQNREIIGRLEGLEKKIKSMEEKPTSELLEEVKKEITKAYAKIAFKSFMDFSKTAPGKEMINNIFTENKDLLSLQLKEVMEGKKGIFSTFRGKLKKYLLTAAGIELLLVMGVVSGGIFYAATRTPVGRYIGYQNKVDEIESLIYAPKKNERGKVVGHENKIDKVEEKQKELEKRLDISVSRKEMEEVKKNSDEQDKAKFESYDKQITDIKTSLDSSNKNYNDFKLNYDELKKDDEKNLKRIEDLQKNNENLEKKMIDSEKTHEKWYKKVIPVK